MAPLTVASVVAEHFAQTRLLQETGEQGERTQTLRPRQFQRLRQVRGLRLVGVDLPAEKEATKPVEQPADAVRVIKMRERTDRRGPVGREFMIDTAHSAPQN